jgi:hypothetical protein
MTSSLAIFWAAAALFQRDESAQAVIERMRELNRDRCVPPLDAGLVRKQVNGAAKWAMAHPTVSDGLREKARQILEDRRVGKPRTQRPASTWEEPVPLASREAAPAFPIETLLDWAAAWASAISAEKGAALDLGASLALDVVAGAIARNVQVSPRPGWYEPTNLYTIVALAPGQRKSPVFKAALRPVRALERVTPHDLRRSFCSLAGRRGVDPIEAAQITGHSPAVWARFYARSFGKTQREEARRRMLEHGFGA